MEIFRGSAHATWEPRDRLPPLGSGRQDGLPRLTGGINYALLDDRNKRFVDEMRASAQIDQKNYERKKAEREKCREALKKMEELCQACGRNEAGFMCSVCNQARYCDSYCQKMDWKIHKNLCKK